MKRTTWLGILVVALVAGAWCISRAFIPTAAAARVTRGKIDYVVQGSVTVVADKESQIASPEDGIIEESHVEPGQAVQAGDLLAQLDKGTLPYDIRSTQAQLDTLKNELAGTLDSEYALASLQKQLELDGVSVGYSVTKADFDKEQNAVIAQKSLAEKDRKNKETDRDVLQNKLDELIDREKHLKILSPYNGTITAVSAHQGDFLPKESPLAKIVSTGVRYLAEINQDDIGNVPEGGRATVKFDAYPAQYFPAQVTRILPSSDKLTQRFTIELDLGTPKINALAGLTGTVIVYAGENDQALRIPRRALYGNNVYVVSGGRVEVRNVKPGFLTLTYAEIKSDPNPKATVAEGEIVLTENLDLLRNGDRVRVTTVADDAAQK